MSATAPGRIGVHTAERVAAVHLTRLLEVGPEEAFIRLTRLASTVLETPMVALTVVDDVRSFLKGMPDTAAVCEPGATFEVPVTDAACRVVVDSGEEVCAPDVRLEPRLRDLRQIHDFGVASWIGVPVLDPGGRVVGNLCAMDTVVRPWTGVHLDTLRMLALAAGAEIALRLALHEADRIAAEAAELAATLQESLVPSHPPRVDGAVIGARFQPGGTGVEVMGDFYDVVPIHGGFGVVIGDVCGKGAPAARTTAMARSALRAVAHAEPDPVRVLGTLNEVLHVWFDGRPGFVTAIYATFTRPTGTPPGSWVVALAVAGHPPAFVRRADGSVEALAGGGRVLGILEVSDVASENAFLGPGDSLVLYTDGVTEARGVGGDDQLDETGAARALARCAPDAGADAVAGALVDAANAHAGQRPTDDIGVVVVLVEPRARSTGA